MPEQYGGYSLQGIRFLQLLLEASPGTTISLEVFEDVGAEREDGIRRASQTKAALVKNPISDRAPEFWKTIANWMDASEEGLLDEGRTIFELYVGRRHPCKIAKLFHDAGTLESAQIAIQEARRQLLDKNHQTKSRRQLPDSLQSVLDRVFDRNRRSLPHIVRAFCLTFPTGDPLSDLRRGVSAKWVRPESVELIVHHAHGWVRERIDRLIQARKPALISVDEFNHEITAFLPRCDFRTILISMAGPPSPEQVEAEKLRTYVRQLELIEAADEDIMQAINDCLRSFVERTLWSKAGIVHDRSFNEFEDALVSYWRNKKRQNSLTRAELSPVQHGQLLLSDCCMKEQRLQGLEVPSFFTPGSYHALADNRALGWHPDYKSRLDSSRTPNGGT